MNTKGVCSGPPQTKKKMAYLSDIITAWYVSPAVFFGFDHLPISDNTPHPQSVKELHVEDVAGDLFYVKTINSMGCIYRVRGRLMRKSK